MSTIPSIAFTFLFLCGLMLPVLAAFIFAVWWHPRLANWFMHRLQTDLAQHPAVQQAAAQPGPGPHRVNPLGTVATWVIMLLSLGAGVGCGALTGWGTPLIFNLAKGPFWLALVAPLGLGGSVGLAVALTVMLAGTTMAMALTKRPQ